VASKPDVDQVTRQQTEQDPAIFYQERDMKSNRVWYYISAVIIVVVSVIVAFLLNPSLKDQLFGKKAVVKPIIVAPVDTLPKIDSTKLKKDSTALMDSLQMDTTSLVQAIEKETVLVKEAVPVAQPNYQLVIATPKTMELAEEEVLRLRKKGYSTVRAVENKIKRNKKRVIWNTYMTKEEADRDQAAVVKKFSGAWVEKISK
jgi:hypothetical protein